MELYRWVLIIHTEVTAFGNAYTYGGIWFVFISMFVLFTLIFTCYRAFCPTFDRSLLATFMVAIYLHFLTAGTVLTLISFLVRTMPFEILLFWSISRIGRFETLSPKLASFIPGRMCLPSNTQGGSRVP